MTRLLNVDVREHVSPAALASQHELIHHGTFGCLLHVLFRKVYNLVGGVTLGQLELPYLRQVVVVLVTKDFAARETLDWDDHLSVFLVFAMLRWITLLLIY